MCFSWTSLRTAVIELFLIIVPAVPLVPVLSRKNVFQEIFLPPSISPVTWKLFLLLGGSLSQETQPSQTLGEERIDYLQQIRRTLENFSQSSVSLNSKTEEAISEGYMSSHEGGLSRRQFSIELGKVCWVQALADWSLEGQVLTRLRSQQVLKSSTWVGALVPANDSKMCIRLFCTSFEEELRLLSFLNCFSFVPMVPHVLWDH